MTLQADVHVALGDFHLGAAIHASPGELVILVGPNGAGKTTLLRVLAGLQRLDSGEVKLDGNTLDDANGSWVPPHRRSVGLVPQADRLFPHLDALSNVAFGLGSRGAKRDVARAEAARWLELLGLRELAKHRPAELSGGQAKRVALARALAIRPRLLLLDEPFAGLDATTRLEVRRELRGYLAEHEGMRLLVTHEPLEALALADRIVVLEQGVVIQSVAPEQLRMRPRSRYVADLVGVNLYRGVLTSQGLITGEGVAIVAAGTAPNTGAGLAAIHPRAVALHRERPQGSPRNVWSGTVSEIEDSGYSVRIRLEGEISIVAELTRAAVAALGLGVGVAAFAAAKASEINLYPA